VYYISTFFYSYTILSKDSFCSLPGTNQSQHSIPQTPNRNFTKFQHGATRNNARIYPAGASKWHIVYGNGRLCPTKKSHEKPRKATKSLMCVVFGGQS
jgi:hypothetical protein